MSGFLDSTGKITNNGEKNLNITDYENKKISRLVIHSIPLTGNKHMNRLRNVGTVANILIHPIFTPTLCHIAIQLVLENDESLLIEYGQYLSKDTDKNNSSIFNIFNSISKSNPKNDFNVFSYWYINKDGARITKLDDKKIKNQYYGNVSKYIAEINGLDFYESSFNQCSDIPCDVNNKITIKELCSYFKGENWESGDYNVLWHNCQKFGAKVIKILKAVRIDEDHKIRTFEKMMLPNCIISEFINKYYG